MDEADATQPEDLRCLFAPVNEVRVASEVPTLKEAALDHVIRDYYKLHVSSLNEILSEDLCQDLLARYASSFLPCETVAQMRTPHM
jgi:hypothetical protein